MYTYTVTFYEAGGANKYVEEQTLEAPCDELAWELADAWAAEKTYWSDKYGDGAPVTAGSVKRHGWRR